MATLDEAQLARAAAAGDGQAFARLYDEYEGRIYNFCLRLVGGPEDAADATQDAFLKVLQRLPKIPADRELNFGAYLFTAARNASYDVIGKRKKADPVDLIPESGARPLDGDERGAMDLDPERATMLGALQLQVQAANERLPERQREVLALRELEELSYDEIAEIMDMNRNSVAQLISRARIRLRDELQGSALASIAAASPECERALPLISLRQDGQLKSAEDREWLEGHVAGCATCKVSVEAMHEAGMSYRAWAPVLPAVWLWKATAAKAMDLTGHDWQAIMDRQRELHSGSPSGGAGTGGGGTGGGGGGAASGGAASGGSGAGGGAGGGAGAVAGATAGAVAGSGVAAAGAEAGAGGAEDRIAATRAATYRRDRRRRAGALIGSFILIVIALLLFLGRQEVPIDLEAGTIDAGVVTTVAATTPTVTTPEVTTPTTPTTTPTKPKARKRPARRRTPRRTVVPAAAPIAVPVPVITPTPVAGPVPVPAIAPAYTPPPAPLPKPKPKPKRKPAKVTSSLSGGGTSSAGSEPTGTTPTPPPATPEPDPTPDPGPTTTPAPDPTVPGATYCQQNPADPQCRQCRVGAVCRRDAGATPPVTGMAAAAPTASARSTRTPAEAPPE